MASPTANTMSFLRNFRRPQRQFAVIGLGRFGRAVCGTLRHMGHEVLGVDREEDCVADALSDQLASHVIQLNSTDCAALREAGLFEFDTVIVAIGNYLQESVITTLNLKEGGVKYVVSKASTEIHGRVLQKVGADRVVYPEREMGCHLARSLVKPNILERTELDSQHSIVEMVVPETFEGQSILELKLRSDYGITVLAVGWQGKEGEFEINPDPTQPLHAGTMMWVMGSNESINRLPI